MLAATASWPQPSSGRGTMPQPPDFEPESNPEPGLERESSSMPKSVSHLALASFL
jgi:hypothetical protein